MSYSAHSKGNREYEEYKRIIRFLFALVLIAMETAAFSYFWLSNYNPLMEIPYNRTGNWLITAVYALLLLIFSFVYGGFAIGRESLFNIIYSQLLTFLSGNVVAYLMITLLTKHFETVVPLLLLSLIEFCIVVFWGLICIRIYTRLYPPRRLLVVYGDRSIEKLLLKIRSRRDRYVIGEEVSLQSGLEEIFQKAELYDGVLIGDIPAHERNAILKYCYGKSIRVYIMPKISDVIIKSAENLHIFDTPLFLAKNDGLSIDQRFIKRCMDILASAFGLLITSPFLLITALAIKLYDGGPVFFCQERCTKDGRVFRIIKFRSMIVNAEAAGKSIPCTEHDPRITPVGRIIRATRIDELPQLINILKGDMSLVGPRPERVEHVDLYSKEIPEFQFRLKVKGGLTGYAQVYGKYNTTAYDKLKLDLMYIQNYSILLDLEIIFKTIKIMFMKESTEGFTEEDSTSINEHSNKASGD